MPCVPPPHPTPPTPNPPRALPQASTATTTTTSGGRTSCAIASTCGSTTRRRRGSWRASTCWACTMSWSSQRTRTACRRVPRAAAGVPCRLGWHPAAWGGTLGLPGQGGAGVGGWEVGGGSLPRRAAAFARSPAALGTCRRPCTGPTNASRRHANPTTLPPAHMHRLFPVPGGHCRPVGRHALRVAAVRGRRGLRAHRGAATGRGGPQAQTASSGLAAAAACSRSRRCACDGTTSPLAGRSPKTSDLSRPAQLLAA